MTERGCFLRVGSSAEPMNREMIETFFGKRVRNTIGRIESPRQDLSFTQLKIYYEGQGLNLNDRFMTNLELLSPEGHPNYAAYLLADENGASLQIAKYAGTDRVDLIENRDFGRCCLVKALYAMLDRVAVENTIYTKITNTNRQEQELIHPIAMREALVNAVVHNDYSYGATAKLEFFSDRAEITSMGGLPYGVNRDDLFGGCSVPRNKEIMRIFRDLNIVEHLGSGIPRILQAYGREAFEVQDSYLRITLPYSKTQGTQPESRPESRPESALANEILKHLEEGPSGKAGLAEKLGHQSISGELNKQIRLLLEQGWIERTLPDKPTSRLQQYRLTSRNNQSL
jgi:predicted HTH transcriptional regulator